ELEKASPRSALVELLWDIDERWLFISGSGNSIRDRAKEIFEATFDIAARPWTSDFKGDGSELLTWLFNLSSQEPIAEFHGPLVNLVPGRNAKVTPQGEGAARAPECAAALESGKRLIKAGIAMADNREGGVTTFTVDAETFDIDGLRLSQG